MEVHRDSMSDTTFPHDPVLLIDDEDEILEGYSLALSKRGIGNYITCRDSRNAAQLLSGNKVSVIVLDLSMPHVSGRELIEYVREHHPHIPIIVATGVKDIDMAIACIQMGIYDYMVKPVEINRLVSNIRRAVEHVELEREVQMLGKHLSHTGLSHPEAFSPIITGSGRMKAVFRYIEAVAPSPKSLVVTGESGVGKELIAQAVHEVSGRKGEFVPVNISGFDDNMFSDALFGHRKGAYTGADSEREGLIRKAEGGTLFLDEIGDLEMKSQVKLLRMLQEHCYYPLGSDKPVSCNVRVIAATNADLKKKQEEGFFRKDLYYRLMTHLVDIPPLRDRMEDIPLLASHFIEQSCISMRKPLPEITGEVYQILSVYHYPGNVRELEGMIHNAVSLMRGKELPLDILKEYIAHHIPEGLDPHQNVVKGERGIISIVTTTGDLPSIEEAEEFLLRKALEKAGGNQSQAAPLLGLTPSTFSRHLKKYGIK